MSVCLSVSLTVRLAPFSKARRPCTLFFAAPTRPLFLSSARPRRKSHDNGAQENALLGALNETTPRAVLGPRPGSRPGPGPRPGRAPAWTGCPSLPPNHRLAARGAY